MQKIDAFPHILPRPVLERMLAAVPNGPAKRWMEGTAGQPGLAVDERLQILDSFEDYRQVLTLATPPIEQVAHGQAGRDLSELANDSLAALCREYPDRFAGFASGLPMDDPDAALRELDRSIGQLGALGIQIFTNAGGLSLDDPRFEPLFARMAELDKPVWVHGARGFERPDFVGEAESRYALWLSFGWPYEMALFMARVVLAGILDRYPNLRILTHHGGGMIPMFGQRFGPGALRFTGPGHDDEHAAFDRLHKAPLQYLQMFYADTTVGPVPRAVRATVDFFGVDHVLFATDMPYGPPGGAGFARPMIDLLQSMGFSQPELEKLFAANARRVLGLAS